MELPHHKDWLTYFGGTNRPGELDYNFPVKNDQKKMLTSCCFFFQSGALYATITHDPWSEYNQQKSEDSRHQRTQQGF